MSLMSFMQAENFQDLQVEEAMEEDAEEAIVAKVVFQSG
jgi:hypothetical protein